MGKRSLGFKTKLEILFIVAFTILTIAIGVCLKVFNSKDLILFSPDVNIVYDEDNKNIVSLVSNYQPNEKIVNPRTAINALNELSPLYGFNSVKEEINYDTTVSNFLGDVYKTSQRYNGIPVYGRGLNIMNLNDKASISGNYLDGIDLDVTPSLKVDQIVESFYNLSDWAGYQITTEPTLTIYSLYEHEPTLCYVFYAVLNQKSVEIFLDANTGEYINHFQKSTNITMPSTVQANLQDEFGNYNTLDVDYLKYQGETSAKYYMVDSVRNFYFVDYTDYVAGTSDFSPIASSTPTGFTNKEAVTVYSTLVKLFDFYKDANNLGVSLNGIRHDNDGIRDYNFAAATSGELVTIVEVDYYSAEEPTLLNAFYSSSGTDTDFFCFGNGDIFSKATDVIGHEYQHGIVNYNAGCSGMLGSGSGLNYVGQSGAINEGYADVFGAITESAIRGYDFNDDEFWQIGEILQAGLMHLGNPAMRDMKNPYQSVGSPDYYRYLCKYPTHINDIHVCTENHNHQSESADCDNNYVHFNNSIISHSFYQIYANGNFDANDRTIAKLMFSVLQNLSTDATFSEWAGLMVTHSEATNDANLIQAVKKGLSVVGLYEFQDKQVLFYNDSTEVGSGYVNNENALLYIDKYFSSTIDYPTVTKTGYTFKGWYTSNTGGLKIIDENGNFTTETITGYTKSGKWNLSLSEIKLYARFELNYYKITFYATTNGGTLSGISIGYVNNFSANIYNYSSGSYILTNYPTATKARYVFTGWWTAANGGYKVIDEQGYFTTTRVDGYKTSSLWNMSQDRILYAQFALEYNQVNFDVGEGSTTDNISNLYVNPISSNIYLKSGTNYSVADFPIPTRTGYEFKGWFTAEDSSGELVLKYDINTDTVELVNDSDYVTYYNGNLVWDLTNTVTLYAQYGLQSFSVTTSTVDDVQQEILTYNQNVKVFNSVYLTYENGNSVGSLTRFDYNTKLYLNYELNQDSTLNKWITFEFSNYVVDGAELKNDANGYYFVVGNKDIVVKANGTAQLKYFTIEFENNAKLSNMKALDSSLNDIDTTKQYPSVEKISLTAEYIENYKYNCTGITWSIKTGNATIINSNQIQYAVGDIVVTASPIEKDKLYNIKLIEVDQNETQLSVTNFEMLTLSMNLPVADGGAIYGTESSLWSVGSTFYINQKVKTVVGYDISLVEIYYYDINQNKNIISIQDGNYSITLLDNKEFIENIFENETDVFNVYLVTSKITKQHTINLDVELVTDDITIPNFENMVDLKFATSHKGNQLVSGSKATFGTTLYLFITIDSSDKYSFSIESIYDENTPITMLAVANPFAYKYNGLNYTTDRDSVIDITFKVSAIIKQYEITFDYDKDNFVKNTSDEGVDYYLSLYNPDTDENIILENNIISLPYDETTKYYICLTEYSDEKVYYTITSIVDSLGKSLNFDNLGYGTMYNFSVTGQETIKINTIKNNIPYYLTLKIQDSQKDCFAIVPVSFDSQNNITQKQITAFDTVTIYFTLNVPNFEYYYTFDKITLDNQEFSVTPKLLEGKDYTYYFTLSNLTKDYTITVFAKENNQQYDITTEANIDGFDSFGWCIDVTDHTKTSLNLYNQEVYIYYDLKDDTKQYKYEFLGFEIFDCSTCYGGVNQSISFDSFEYEDGNKKYFKFTLDDEFLEKYSESMSTNFYTIHIKLLASQSIQSYSVKLNFEKEYAELMQSKIVDFNASVKYSLDDGETELDFVDNLKLDYGTIISLVIRLPLESIYFTYEIDNNFNLIYEIIRDSFNKSQMEKNLDYVEIKYSADNILKIEEDFQIDVTIKQTYQEYDVKVFNDLENVDYIENLKLSMNYDLMNQNKGIDISEMLADIKTRDENTFVKKGYSFKDNDYILTVNNAGYCPLNYVDGEYSENYLPTIQDIKWNISVYPNWIANRYKITFNALEGTINETTNKTTDIFVEFDTVNLYESIEDTTTTSIPSAQKENYQFLGWYLENDSSFEFPFTSGNDDNLILNIDQDGNLSIDSVDYILNNVWVYDDDISLVAKYGGLSKELVLVNPTVEKKLYIEYSTNVEGGLYNDSSRTNKHTLKAPSKYGYNFEGYYLEDGRQFITSDLVILDVLGVVESGIWVAEEQIKGYAKFSQKVVTVMFENMGGTLTQSDLSTLYFVFESNKIYKDIDCTIPFESFELEYFASKIGYTFAGWFKDYACSTPIFAINDGKLQWNLVSGFTTEKEIDGNTEIVFKPSSLSNIKLYAGYTVNRYSVDFESEFDIKGYKQVWFEYNTSKIYTAAQGGIEITIGDLPLIDKTGYRITSWVVSKVGDVELIENIENIFTYSYSNLFTTTPTTIYRNANLVIESKNCFSQNNWQLTKNLVVKPVLENIAIEISLTTDNSKWYQSDDFVKVSYYAKYDDNKIYKIDNSTLQLVEIAENEIPALEITNIFKNVYIFGGWGFNDNTDRLLNSLLLGIGKNTLPNSLTVHLNNQDLDITDEQGNFVYTRTQTLKVVPVARIETQSLKFVVGNDEFIKIDDTSFDQLEIQVYYESTLKDILKYNKLDKLPIAEKTGYTFKGWKVQGTDIQVLEIFDESLSFVTNVEQYVNSDSKWVCVQQETILEPIFQTNIYSIEFKGINKIPNSNTVNLICENGESIKSNSFVVYFEYNTNIFYDSMDIENSNQVAIPLANSEGFEFIGWTVLNQTDMLFDNNGLLLDVDGLVKDGKLVVTGNLVLESEFKEIFFKVDIYANSETIIGTYYKKYTSNDLYKLVGTEYVVVENWKENINLQESYKEIKTIECNYNFKDWAIVETDKNGNSLMLNESLGLFKTNQSLEDYKITKDIIVAPNYDVILNTYSLNFFVDEMDNPYNKDKTKDYGFKITVYNFADISKIEYGRTIEFSIELFESHNNSTEIIYVNNVITELPKTLNKYKYTISEENNILITGVEINKYLVKFKLPNGEIEEQYVEHGQSAIKPNYKGGSTDIIWVDGQYSNITQDTVIIIKKINIMIPVSIGVVLLAVVVIVVVIKKNKNKKFLKEQKAKTSAIMNSQVNNNQNTPQQNTNNQSYNQSNNSQYYNQNGQTGNYNQNNYYNSNTMNYQNGYQNSYNNTMNYQNMNNYNNANYGYNNVRKSEFSEVEDLSKPYQFPKDDNENK